MASRDLVATFGVILLYLFVSPTAIVLNKMLLTERDFPFPITISAVGQSLSLAVGYIALRQRRSKGMLPPSKTHSMTVIGAAASFTLISGQYPYLYLSMAFIQMLKAFTPVYMVLLLCILDIERPNRKVTACVLGMTGCAIIAAFGEVRFHTLGFLLMVLSSVGDSVRLVVTQKVLTNDRHDGVEVLFFVNLFALPWTLVASLMSEAHNLWSISSMSPETRVLIFASGLAGAGVNICSILVVARTSSLMLKAITMARNAGLVIFSTIVFGETVTRTEALAYVGLLIIFGIFTHEKSSHRASSRQAERDAARV